MNQKGMLIIISGPSGSGKGTVVKKLDPGRNYALSISYTTREKRSHEIEGKDYFFCTEDEFFAIRAANQLLEHAQYGRHYYGTPRFYVEDQIQKNKTVVLEIEVNGALQVKEKFPDAVLIFLLPPTMCELQRRLTERNTESIITIDERIRRAEEEIKLIGKYNYLVVNDTVEQAVRDIDIIVTAESLKPHRNQDAIQRFMG